MNKENRFPKPLEGYKVIELSTFVAAPVCGRMMADLGADVIKIEIPAGDVWRDFSINLTKTSHEENPLFDIENCGKKSICLNLKEERGMKLLFKLLDGADVFITNTRMKSLNKLGINPEALCAKYPRLVYAHVNGYGTLGPNADDPGFDNVAFWTRTGFLADMSFSTENSYPVCSPTGVGDTITGVTMLAGILAVLTNRAKTGKGDVVSCSLYHTGIWAMGSMILRAQERYQGQFPSSIDNVLPLDLPYKCADGEWLKITIIDLKKQVPILLEILGVKDELEKQGVTTPNKLFEGTKVVVPVFQRKFAEKTSHEWYEILRNVDIVAGLMTHFKDVANDEQAWANNFVEDYEFLNGNHCAMPTFPIKLNSMGVVRLPKAPQLGQDTNDVLTKLGCSSDEIERLRADCVIK